MELLSRPKNDRYTRPGEYTELERNLRANSQCGQIPVLVCYSFDFRTRVGPFLFADMRLLTAGVRAIGAALHNSGFTKMRIAQRQWNPNLRVDLCRLDGEVPQMLFVSSMQIHSASAYEMVAHAYRLGADRPLIFAGGPKAIYEPWDFFNCGPEGKYNADVVVTGEEFVALEVLDRIMSHKSASEHPRKTFHRLRRSGLLDDIAGLVFREGDENDPHGRLINTGVQRMVQDLDELPHPLVGLALLEAPHKRHTISRRPIPLHKMTRFSEAMSLVTTHGCKFHCPYCPIPAYNQFTFRFKSPERLREEIQDVAEKTGIDFFFGTDDNFFNNRETVEDTFKVLSKGTIHGKPFREVITFGTEATEFDVYKNIDLLPLCRQGGLRAIWFGIEDMTAELVKKGQSPEKTRKLFEVMNQQGIAPMSMMMHHDGQPLTSRGNLYGLLNQARYLRRSGSVSLQVTMLTPSVGSKSYEEPFQKGMVIDQAGSKKIEDHQFDGNHCVATEDPHPWRKQMNIYLAYASFYNPVNFLRAVLNWKDPLWSYRTTYQLMGMAGMVKSLRNSASWMWNLYRGPITMKVEAPRPKLEMVSPTVTAGKAAPVMQYQSV